MATECGDEEVYIVGGANSAGQAAVNLSQYAKRVTLAVRGPSLEASMSYYLIQQVEAIDNITVRTCTVVRAVSGNDHLEKLILEDQRTGATEHVDVRPDVLLHRRRTAHRLVGRGGRT